MKVIQLYLTGILLLSSALTAYGQGKLSYLFIPDSPFLIGHTPYESGAMQLLSGHYAFFSSSKKERPTWAISLNASYGLLKNKGKAKSWHPDDLFNGILHVTQSRPLSERWMRISTVSIGCYAPTRDLSWQSLLADGSMLFVYRWPNGISLGVGGGLSHLFGFPLLLPLFYFNWQTTGTFEVKVDMSSGLKTTASYQLTPYIQLEATALDISGMAAIMKQEGKNKVYSMTFIRSYISAVWKVYRHLEGYVGFGENWTREIRITNRSLKGFLHAMQKPKAEEMLRYKATPHLTAGIRVKL